MSNATTRLPADRTFVDERRQIVNPWHGVLKQIEPFLAVLTPENIASLKEVIAEFRAAATSPDDEDNIFNLPIDEAPLTTEDFVVGTKTSENNAGRRYPLSLFARPALLTSVTLSGLSTYDFILPSAYNNFRILLKGASVAADATQQLRFSADAGSTFINTGYHMFDDGGDYAGPTNGTTANITGTMAAASNWSHIIEVFDALASRKLVRLSMIDGAGNSAVGMIVLGAVIPDPLNLIRLQLSTSAWDNGTADLWGIP